MRARRASAPGKAVLIGEYAVLDGAPAVVMAVDRRARVRIEPAEGPRHRVVSANSGAGAEFRARTSGELEWLAGAAGEFALLEAVWRALRPRPDGALAITLDSREFFAPGAGPKLGMGSSAAVAVALAAALAGPGVSAEELSRTALAAHRGFQGGRGSGVDVAAAVHGGVLRYRREARDRGPRAEALGWPRDLAMCLLWSGHPADTAAGLARLAAADAAAARRALAAAAEEACRLWSGDATAALEALAGWAAALQDFDGRARLGIFAAGHDALFREAARCGLVYKPCGAGGGDAGAAFARDRAALDAFAELAAARGFARVAATLDRRGVTTESDTA